MKTAPAPDTVLSTPNPFKFLSYFEEKDSHLFTGRDREICESVARITSEPTYILCGRGGIGKTSFLLAGVFPALRKLGYQPIYVRTLQNPVGDLQAALSETSIPLQSEDELIGRLRSLTSNNPVVLLFDQFEEFFLRFPVDQRTDFIRRLSSWITHKDLQSRLRIVLSLREDYLAQLTAEFRPHLPRIDSPPPDRLSPLSAFAARVAIENPLVHAQIAYDRDLVSRVIDTLTPTARHDAGFDPPLLQILCSELFEEANRRQADSDEALRLRSTDLDRVGGLDGVFQRFLDRALAPFDNDAKRLPACLVLDALVFRNRDKKATPYPDLIKHSEFEVPAEEIDHVLESFEKAHLIRKDIRNNERWYELIHERLVEFLTAWLQSQKVFFGFRTARQTLANASSLDLWRKRSGALLPAAVLSEIIGPYKTRFHLDPNQCELLYWSAVYHRHEDVLFWTSKLGADLAKQGILGLLQVGSSKPGRFPEYDGADREALLRSALAWCCQERDADPSIADACRRFAADAGISPELRLAAARAFRRHANEDQKATLHVLLGEAATNVKSFKTRVIAPLQRKWHSLWGSQERSEDAAQIVRSDGVDLYLSEVLGPETPPLNIVTVPSWTWRILGETLGRTPLWLGIPGIDCLAFRKRHELVQLRGKSALIRERREIGSAVGTNAATIFVLSWGSILTIGLSWILGNIDPNTFPLFVSVNFFLSTLCIGWMVTALLGYLFGDWIAKTNAHEAILTGEGRWFWAVCRSRRLWFVVYLGLFLIFSMSIYFATENISVTSMLVAAAAAMLYLLPIFCAMAGIVHTCRFLLKDQSPLKSLKDRVRHYGSTLIACAGLPNLLTIMLYSVNFPWIPMKLVSSSEVGNDLILSSAEFRHMMAWTTSSLLGVFLSATVFILVNALAISTRRAPIATAPPIADSWRWLAAHSACLMVCLAAFCLVYEKDTFPLLAYVARQEGKVIQLDGNNERLYDQDYTGIHVSAPAGSLVDCKPVPGQSQNNQQDLSINNERARFERDDRQLYFLPPGRHLAHVQRNKHTSPTEADQSSKPVYNYVLTQHEPIREAKIELGIAEGQESFVWCVCKHDGNQRWIGDLQVSFKNTENAPAFVAIQVGRDFFIKKKDSSRFEPWDSELQDQYFTQPSDKGMPPSNNSRWGLTLAESEPGDVLALDANALPRKLARIDFPGPTQPKRLITFMKGRTSATLKFILETTDTRESLPSAELLLLVQVTVERELKEGTFVGEITTLDAISRKTRNAEMFANFEKVKWETGKTYFVASKKNQENWPIFYIEDRQRDYLRNELDLVALSGIQESQPAPWKVVEIRDKEASQAYGGLYYASHNQDRDLVIGASLRMSEESKYDVAVYQAAKLTPGEKKICFQSGVAASCAFATAAREKHVFLTNANATEARIICESTSEIYVLKPISISVDKEIKKAFLWTADRNGACEFFLTLNTKALKGTLEHGRAPAAKTVDNPKNTELGSTGSEIRTGLSLTNGNKSATSGKFEAAFTWNTSPKCLYLVEMKARKGKQDTTNPYPSALDSYLILRDFATGRTLAEDDDSGGNLDAQIFFHTNAEKVRVVATSFGAAYDRGTNYDLWTTVYEFDRLKPDLIIDKRGVPLGYYPSYPWKPGYDVLVQSSRPFQIYDHETSKPLPWQNRNAQLAWFPHETDSPRTFIPAPVSILKDSPYTFTLGPVSIRGEAPSFDVYEMNKPKRYQGVISKNTKEGERLPYQDLTGFGPHIFIPIANERSVKLKLQAKEVDSKEPDVKKFELNRREQLDFDRLISDKELRIRAWESGSSISIPRSERPVHVFGQQGLFRLKISK